MSFNSSFNRLFFRYSHSLIAIASDIITSAKERDHNQNSVTGNLKRWGKSRNTIQWSCITGGQGMTKEMEADMPNSDNGIFNPMAQYARLSERVENQGKDIVDLRSNMNTGFQSVNAALRTLSNELRSKSRANGR